MTYLTVVPGLDMTPDALGCQPGFKSNSVPRYLVSLQKKSSGGPDISLFCVAHSQSIPKDVGGLFTNSQYVSAADLTDEGVRWFLVTWLCPPPTTCFPPPTRWPDLRCGPFVRPVWFLLVHLCLRLSVVSFVQPPLSDDRRLAQMTRLHLLSNHLPPLTRIVNLGRACQCLARGRILRGPQGSLVHTWPPSAPFVFGSLQGAAQRCRRVPNSQFAAATNALYCCFLLRFGGKIGRRRWQDIARDGLISLAHPSNLPVLFCCQWLPGKGNDDDDCEGKSA